MLNSLSDFLKNGLSRNKPAEPGSSGGRTDLAAAVLMVEISLADSSLDNDERRLILKLLRDEFHLTPDESESILTLAQEESDHAVSMHEFTRLINEALSADEKVRIIELLWQVAFADSVLDKYEEYYIRKIADLLYIPHKDYIMAKHRSAAE